MTKLDIIRKISGKTGATIKDTVAFLDAFTGVATESLSQGDDVVLTGFGTFSQITRKARTARNFKTKEIIKVPASKSVKFKCGKTLKDAVN